MTRAASLLGHSHGFIWDQGMPATVWTVVHNMNRRPSITVVDSSFAVVIGQMDYIDNNTVTITFSAPFSGKAYLN
jgi:hypothetical protein